MRTFVPWLKYDSDMDWMEIFTLVTGIIYLVLEIRQKNFMWILGIINALAAMYMFWKGALYASFGLNAYYFLISFWGLYQWRRDAAGLARTPAAGDALAGETAASGLESGRYGDCMQAEDGIPEKKGTIHLNRLTWRTSVASAIVMAVFSAVLIFLLDRLDDPMSSLDAPVAVLGAIATFWLSRSYKEQWLLWIVANLFSTALCLTQGLYWMSVLYLVYTLSSIYGYFHWKRHGSYVDRT